MRGLQLRFLKLKVMVKQYLLDIGKWTKMKIYLYSSIGLSYNII